MTAVCKEYTNALKMEATKTSTKTNKMAKDTKTAKKTETPAAAPAKEVKAKAPKKEKATTAKAEVVVPTVAAPVVPATPAQSSDAQLASLTEKLKALSTEFTSRVREAVKATQAAAAQAKREARDSKKKRKVDPSTLNPEQRAAWEARRANNAFLKQKPLSDELCAFMGLPAKSKRSQTEVTKYVSEYVKSHSCYDPSFKRRILPNAVLAKLLRVDDKTEVTYLNLQRFLKVHFIKA
jgi:chromatin remodeling complex protein RSC6